MSPVPDISRRGKAQVFERLARAPAGAVTVVTPNRRLALALTRDFDEAQAAAGLEAWESADILPLTAFIERAYEDALYSELASGLPMLLRPAQELALWEGIIRGSEAGAALLAIPETARLAREAWQILCAWQLAPRLRQAALSEDGKAFAAWAQRYERDTKRDRFTEEARLSALVAERCAHQAIRKPGVLVRYGFDIETPQQQALFAALATAGCEIWSSQADARTADAVRLACADSRDEIQRAAAWARARIEANSGARIAVVVPALAPMRSAIVRVFSAMMAPDYALPGAPARMPAFNVSIGTALTSYPLVSTAFLALELAGREIEFERASRLLRSPFLAGAETELASRARLDAQLRRRAEPVLSIDRLVSLVARDGMGCPILARCLVQLAEFRKARLFAAQAPSALAKAMSEALTIVGFPGERALDSTEYQTLKKWHEVVAELAALDRVLPRMGYGEGLARLRRLAADTLFQPETPTVPVQVLGVLEAAGMEFDHLWVMGLSDEAWPQSPRPNPFVPVELQRACGLPNASAAASLLLARTLTAGWLSCAGEVVLSYPRREVDRELKPSPLIVQVVEREPALPAYPSYRDIVHGAGRLERIEDSTAPPLPPAAALHGGTAIFADQAACAFRAFAVHRLGAEGLEAPHTGLDAGERGDLVHRMLAQAWSELGTRAVLEATGDAELEALLTNAAQAAIARIKRHRPSTLSGRFAAIEQRRLVQLARSWLAHEKSRGGFTVVATEDKRLLEIGGLAFNARLDRVDELEDGRRIVIDYKTGSSTVGSLLGARPDQPQMPLYLVAGEPRAIAVAFAKIKVGDMKYVALARDVDAVPGACVLPDSKLKQAAPTWNEQVDAWRRDLTRIAQEFAGGAAAVDPKKYPDTCRYCDVKPFCRVYERLESALEEDAI